VPAGRVVGLGDDVDDVGKQAFVIENIRKRVLKVLMEPLNKPAKAVFVSFLFLSAPNFTYQG